MQQRVRSTRKKEAMYTKSHFLLFQKQVHTLKKSCTQCLDIGWPLTTVETSTHKHQIWQKVRAECLLSGDTLVSDIRDIFVKILVQKLREEAGQSMEQNLALGINLSYFVESTSSLYNNVQVYEDLVTSSQLLYMIQSGERMHIPFPELPVCKQISLQDLVNLGIVNPKLSSMKDKNGQDEFVPTIGQLGLGKSKKTDNGLGYHEPVKKMTELLEEKTNLTVERINLIRQEVDKLGHCSCLDDWNFTDKVFPYNKKNT